MSLQLQVAAEDRHGETVDDHPICANYDCRHVD